MRAQSAGSLEIDFITNLAKLKSDMDQAERAVGTATGGMGRSLAAMNDNMGRVTKTSQAMRMSFAQIPDVISGLATGQKPMTILIQQGLQVVQVAQMAQGGLKGFAMEVGALALRFAPLLGAIGVAVAGFELFKARISDDDGLKTYSKSLGLTHAEMKKLGDVSVTTGDIIKGTWKTLVDALDLSRPLGNAKKLLGEAADWAVDTFKAIGASVYSTFVGGYRMIVDTWRQWPAVLGDLFAQAVNGAASTIEFLLNKSIDSINALGAGANKLTGLNLFGTVDHVALARMQNAYAGAAEKAGKVAGADYAKAYAEGLKGLTALSDKLFENINATARARVKKLADAIIADRTPKKAKKEHDIGADIDSGRLEAIASQYREVAALMDRLDTPIRPNMAPVLAFLNSYVDGLDEVKLAEQAANDEMDRWNDTVDRIRDAADGLYSSWGNVGRSIGDAITILGEYGKRQAEIDQQKKLAGNDQQKLDQLAKQSAALQLNSLIGITDAAKNLFSEHSKGYKAMAAAEKALTIIQLARTAVDVAGGAARMFATLGPLAFPAVGAMLAVMASLGFSGGGSGGSLPASNQGKGTVLGASDMASASIKNSIEALGDIDRITMQYSAQMAASLKSIESNIGGLASLLVRTGNISGATAGVRTGFNSSLSNTMLDSIAGPAGLLLGPIIRKIPIIGDVLSGLQGIVKSLFGTKTSIVGSGIFGASQNLGSILSNGFDLQTYADIQKKKKFLGFTTGTKYSTQYGAADQQVADQFGLILKSFYDAIGAAAVPLGKSTADVEHQLDSFIVSIGKIDFTGLSGDDIQKKLEAVFGAAADQMASGVFPEIVKFQQVGEGAFETLTRVASTVETVTSELNMLGLTSKSLGIDASMALAGLFDSVDAMKSATQAYFETFYTTEEQAAIKTKQLGDAFTSLGLTMPANIAAYRALVDAQDLTTAAGQQTYAMLIQLAPAFAQISTAAQDATSAAAILRERNDLQMKLLEMQGDTAAIRAAELAKLDPSNRALQEQIYALQDQQAAADAAAQAEQAAAQAAQEAAAAAQAAAQKTDQLRQAWQSIGETIEQEIDRIRGLTGNGGTQSYASLLAQFNASTDAARHGDQNAAKSLPELSKEMLDAAALVATSRQELDRVQAQAAASLEQTLAMINAATAASSAATSRVLGPDTSAADGAAWWNSYAPAAPANETASLKAEVQGLRADLRTGLAAIAGHTKKTAKTLDDVTNGEQTINTALVA